MAYEVHGSAELAVDKPYEAFRHCEKTNKGNIVVASVEGRERQVETRWIKSCAEAYNISDDISDYIIVPVPIVTSDIPNRNMQCFPTIELTSWNTDAGRMVYQTFIGKPLFLDHKNDNPKESRGVILDSVLKFVPKYNLWKVVILTAWCRTKDKDVANHILKDPKSEYSMGSMVNTFVEYPSGNVVSPKTRAKRRVGSLDKNGNLIYDLMNNSTFFETSLVLSTSGAADFSATNKQNDILIRPGEINSMDY